MSGLSGKGELPTGPHIVIVGPVPPPMHGVARATQNLVDSELVSSAFVVRHLDTSDRRSLSNLGRVDLHNTVLALKAVGELARLCSTEHPDLLYYTLSQNSPAIVRDVSLVLVARLFGTGSVAQLAGARYGEFLRRRGFAGRLMRFALRRADRILVLGGSQRSEIAALSGHNRVGVVPNGLNSEEIPARVLRHSEQRSHALYLGALVEAKGLVIAIEALGLARAAGLRITLTCGGEWADERFRDKVGQLLNVLDLQGAVDFPGLLSGVAKQDALERADVFVLPSFAEGQPISILEAMAAGLPVVSTAVGAIPDTVQNGVTGILTEVGDAGAMAGALAFFCEHPAVRLSMGDAGRRRVRQVYTLDATHRQLIHELGLALLARDERVGRAEARG